MQTSVELPKAFSVADDREFPLVQDLMARLNPKLLVVHVAMGVHVNGGPTVHWGLVCLDRQPLLEKDVRAALEDAGLDFRHDAQIRALPNWINREPELIEKTSA